MNEHTTMGRIVQLSSNKDSLIEALQTLIKLKDEEIAQLKRRILELTLRDGKTVHERMIELQNQNKHNS